MKWLQNKKSMRADTLVIGADIGGSHITAAMVDMKNRQICPGTLVRNRVDAHADAISIINAWADTLSAVRGTIPVKKLSIAMPGPFDYDAGISLITNQDKYEALYGLNVKELLAEALNIGVEDIYLNNDAACFLEGEVFGGALKDEEKALGFTLGTGLGSSKFENGTSIDLGLWNLPYKNTIAEDYLSTRWFLKRYQELSGNTVKGVKEMLADNAAAGYAVHIFEEFADNLTDFLRHAIHAHNIHTVVLGGNIANAFHLFGYQLDYILPIHFNGVKIRKAELGEEAALIGAASHWANNTKLTTQ